MTRAEAIEVLQFLQDGDYPKRTEALQMGIEALKGLSSYEGTICKLTKIIAERSYCARCGANMRDKIDKETQDEGI